ncbi:PREDICTED: uncharacterized protein LOC104753360 [Camelina sativa]|uniref:Uncharacterized protein LOC104753360 n=1 Tax=Camelina sativa TaxID=90675 RepID=A0ABM0WP11_CAMSA|nr:PREDICTED: uncharacterized protein LOC104753360 [Camelina sativa]
MVPEGLDSGQPSVGGQPEDRRVVADDPGGSLCPGDADLSRTGVRVLVSGGRGWSKWRPVVTLLVNEGESLNFIVVYATPTISRRSGLWDRLTEVMSGVVGPLVVGGDFNTIVRLDERAGGNGRLSYDSLAFGDWINDSSLIDMGFWWQDARVTHLPFLSSHHAPLYVQFAPEISRDPKRRPFRWNKEVFGAVQKRKELLLTELERVQNFIELSPTDELLEIEDSLLKDFDLFLEQEEMLWFQKSREKWINFGGRNTSYFHTSTVIRRRRNRIEMLKNEEGGWITDTQELESLAVHYYTRLYSLQDVHAVVEKLPSSGFMSLSVADHALLNRPFLLVDIEGAIRGTFPPETNDVLLVLIAKVAKPERITQFRPIRGYVKTGGFIPGRLSTDNIVVVQEAVHSMKRKKGRKGWMLLKLDLEKAYDRIRWDFLEDTLGVAGLSEGDPLSPFLFVLCMERLCHLIDRAVVNKQWKPISLSRGGPQLSHICFADDLILFAEASVAQIRVLRSVLEQFCGASGQKVSLEKSKIFFSNNVSRELGKLISEESGIKSTKDLGKYLGMPVLQKRLNKETFGEVLERVSSRLAGWKSHTLSLAGRLTLTKALLSSIPVHSMSTIMLPKATLASLDKISRTFLWGGTGERRKQNLVSWKKVCMPKGDGGLGIRASKDMNKALIAKVGWRLLHDKQSLWARVLRSKYKVGVVKSNWSSTWRSTGTGLREVVCKGQNWVLGDGQRVKFWTDRWLSHSPLVELETRDVPAEVVHEKACDLWKVGVGWDLDKILPYVSSDTRLELAAFVLVNDTDNEDQISWEVLG